MGSLLPVAGTRPADPLNARRRFWLAYALVWALAIPPYALVLYQQGRTSLSQSAFYGAWVMMTGALLGVGIWWATTRLEPGRVPRTVLIGAHALLAAAFGAAWAALQTALAWIEAGPQIAQQVWQNSGLWTMLYGSFVYGGLAGIFHAVRTMRALREQQLAAARAEALAVQAQLVALRAQLNPHFLFNALHSLGALVRHDPRAAETAIDHLGALLRYALDEGAGDTVDLAAEWAFTSNYLALEQLRLGDRLHLDVSIADDTLDCRVPPFILQPLVENAVRHGIAVKSEGGRLTIASHRENGSLHLRVHDDGPGAETAALAGATGLGLRGVRRQVEARYDGRGIVTVTTSPGRGFNVDVEIPA